MKLFFSYLHSVRQTLWTFLGAELIYTAFFLLYRLPLPALLYPLLLSLLGGAVSLVLGFLRTKQKYDTLTTLSRLAADAPDTLPEPDSPAEEAYVGIIRSLQAQSVCRAQEEAEKFRDMTEYYTVWAHQIKTPIAAMKLALQEEDSPLSRQLNADLLRVERYAEMVLAFLRLDSEDTDYVFRPCALDEIIRRELRSFAPDFIHRRLSLEFVPTNDTVVTDEKWLGFVIGQLISNALKYTKEGGIRVFMPEPDLLRISDTGIGIDPADLPRIFDRGYTGFNGREDRQSSGIGLWLCRRICDNLGVGIRAESTPGQGTSVFLDLGQYRLRRE